MTSIAPAHSQNRLLAALTPTVLGRLAAHLELTDLELGASIYEPGDRLQHVYFPIDSIVSLHYVLTDGSTAGFAVVGNDGVVGVSLFMGGESTPSRAMVQSPGRAFRLDANALGSEFGLGGVLQRQLLRYTQALIMQMTQTAVCNRHHSLNQQLCRWLLLSRDLLPTNTLYVTQELIADMLGVRRVGVTLAAGKLQAAGLIKCDRGRITILDRAGLEARVCECYKVVKRESDRLYLHREPATPLGGE